MKATFATLIMFLLIAPKSRTILAGWMGDAGTWMAAWSPLSYLIVLLVVAAPIAAAVLMLKWPKAPDPENPMARFKDEAN